MKNNLILILTMVGLSAFGQFHNYPSTPWASTNLNTTTNFDGNLTNNNGTIGLSPSASVNQATNLVGLATASIVTNIVLNPSGTNNQSATINAAFSQNNSVVTINPGNYYATNLFITATNIVINGNNAHFYQLLGVASQGYYATNNNWFAGWNTNVNALITIGPYAKNVVIHDLTLDGSQANFDYFDNSTFPVWTGEGQNFYPMLVNGGYAQTNNFGLFANLSAGGDIYNITAINFYSAGFLLCATAGAYGQNGPITAFHDCDSETNFIGYYFQDWGQFNGPGAAPEYATPYALHARNCAIGSHNGASNLQMRNCDFQADYVGLSINQSFANAGPHTSISGINLNHNNWGLVTCLQLDYLSIVNFYEAVTATNIFINPKTIQVTASTFQNLYIDGGGPYGSTNYWVQFDGCQLYSITWKTNTIKFDNCFIGNNYQNPSVKLSGVGGNIFAFNNTTFGFNWTNWTTDVITNIGGTYAGNNNIAQATGQSDNGNYYGIPYWSGTNNAVQNQVSPNTSFGMSNLVVNGVASGNGGLLTGLQLSIVTNQNNGGIVFTSPVSGSSVSIFTNGTLNFFAPPSAASPSTPALFNFAQNNAGTYYERFILGDINGGFQGASGEAQQFYSYHELILQGGRATTAPVFTLGNGAAYNTVVLNNSAAQIGLRVVGTNATGDLQRWESNYGTVVAKVSAGGAITANQGFISTATNAPTTAVLTTTNMWMDWMSNNSGIFFTSWNSNGVILTKPRN